MTTIFKFAQHAAAFEIAFAGIPVLPLQPKGKIPICKWTDASIDPEQIDKWWSYNPEFNVGILTGEPSGIIILDFDSEDVWELCKSRGLPDAPLVKTGKGYHLYCKYQPGLKTRSKMFGIDGFDIRTDGGLVVVPPSVHENGNIYSWVEGCALNEKELGDLPEWLFIDVKEVPVVELLDGVTEGGRNDALARVVGSMLHKGMSYDDVVTAAYEWNLKNDPPDSVKKVQATVDSIYKREEAKMDANAEWGDPVLFSNVETPEIRAELLPSWLGAYAKEVSRFNQTPEGLAVMAGLAAIATCVQKRFEVSALNNDYKEILAIWTVTVLPPSDRKTPVINAITAPISKWEREQRSALESSIRENKRNRSIALKQIEKLEKDIIKEETLGKRHVLTSKIHEIEASIPAEIREPKLWASEGTPERLQDLLVENGERISLLADEGGIFEIMAGMYSNGKVNIDVLLNGYSGSPIRVERRTRVADLQRPAVTFGITIQPQVIESFAHGSKSMFRGKGALARFLYCLPKSRLGNRFDEPHDIPVDIKRQYENGIYELLRVQPQLNETGLEIPRILTLDNDARLIWKSFLAEVEHMLGPNSELQYIQDWGGKLVGNSLRIAGLMHLVEHGTGNLVIGPSSMGNAVTLCRLLKEHAKCAFGVIGNDENINNAKKVFSWIERNGFVGFAKAVCHKALEGSFPRVDVLDKALKVLEERNIVKLHMVHTKGRTANCYEINPKVAILYQK